MLTAGYMYYIEILYENDDGGDDGNMIMIMKM